MTKGSSEAGILLQKEQEYGDFGVDREFNNQVRKRAELATALFFDNGYRWYEMDKNFNRNIHIIYKMSRKSLKSNKPS